MSYRRIEVARTAGALGAVVCGVDLAALDDETFDEIRRALLDHLVLFFHDQDLSIEAQKAFGQRFGRLHRHPYVAPVEDHPEVIEIVKEPADVKNFGGGWHADLTYLEQPMMGAVLYAQEVPAAGGDTLFANMYLAYETLSPGLRGLLDGLAAVHDDRDTGYFDRARVGSMQLLDDDATSGAADVGTRAAHPVVRTHPETGRDALFVNQAVTVRFQEMSEAESHPLLDYLFRHLERPEFTCRFRWRQGSVALWDNRCTQHRALNDYPGQRRAMRRVLVAGDRPYHRGG
jgi:taurine dioxygenase